MLRYFAYQFTVFVVRISISIAVILFLLNILGGISGFVIFVVLISAAFASILFLLYILGGILEKKSDKERSRREYYPNGQSRRAVYSR